jgi:ATP-dependent Clp protease ATP-binding subunit ClpA
MARLISTKVKEPLVDAVLFGTLSEGGAVVVEAEGEELKLSY